MKIQKILLGIRKMICVKYTKKEDEVIHLHKKEGKRWQDIV